VVVKTSGEPTEQANDKTAMLKQAYHNRFIENSFLTLEGAHRVHISAKWITTDGKLWSAFYPHVRRSAFYTSPPQQRCSHDNDVIAPRRAAVNLFCDRSQMPWVPQMIQPIELVSTIKFIIITQQYNINACAFEWPWPNLCKQNVKICMLTHIPRTEAVTNQSAS